MLCVYGIWGLKARPVGGVLSWGALSLNVGALLSNYERRSEVLGIIDHVSSFLHMINNNLFFSLLQTYIFHFSPPSSSHPAFLRILPLAIA